MRQLLTLILIVSPFFCFAQLWKPYVKHLTKDQGLSSNKVMCIAQDKDGFMWFGTEDGLSRFDGSKFEIFRHDNKDKNSLSYNYINCIYEDPLNGNLWIGTRQGLNYFDKSTYKFYRDYGIPKNDTILSKRNIYAVLVDHEGNRYVATIFGLYVYDKRSASPVFYLSARSPRNSEAAIYSLFEDSKHNIWIGTGSGLEVFDPQTKTFEPYKLCDSAPMILSIMEDSRKILWISTNDHGVFAIQNGIVKRYCKENKYLQDNKVRSVVEDDKGNMYFAVRDGGGLYYLDYKSHEIKIISPDENDPNSLSSGTILSLYRDKFANIWVGAWNGLNFIDKNRKPFLHYKNNHKPDGLINNNFRSAYQDNDGTIWIGTRDGGCLSKFNSLTGTFVHYKSRKNDSNSLISSYVLSISEAKPGYLFVGTYNGGLELFNKLTGRFQHHAIVPLEEKPVSQNHVYCIEKDRLGKVWVATINDLFTFDLSTRKFTPVKGIRYVRDIIDYSDEEIYFGSINGLYLLNRKENKITLFDHKDNDPSSIRASSISSMVCDSKGKIWLATYGGGLNVFDPKIRKFKAYTIENGLPNNITCAIQVDNHDKLWISTTDGLSKFDPVTEKFRNYSVLDGLQGNEFEKFASCKTSDGYMIFGGSNGFNYFYPDSIRDNPVVPKVVFTNLKIFNKRVLVNGSGSPLQKHINLTPEISFNHKQSLITFEFVALNFTSPENNQYAYKLGGFEDNWNYVGNKGFVTFTGLPSGKYTLMVKASNNDGLWNETPTSISINILPPPWKSWWAFLIYISIVCLVIYGLLNYYETRRNYKTKLKIAQIEKEKLEELNRIKMQFFTNISHEFKTPLTLIITPLKQLVNNKVEPEQMKNTYGYIMRSALRLQNLINQLMDFRSIGNNHLQPVYKQGDMVGFIQEILSIFQPVAKGHKIKMIFRKIPDEFITYFDEDKTEKVLYNLLSNAIKFTPEKGSITVDFSLENNGPGYIKIEVINTGSFIPKEEIPLIFETYYHPDRYNSLSQPGTGIGLAFTKELVDLLGGQIVAASNHSETSFTVYFPVVNQIESSVVTNGTNQSMDTFRYTRQLMDVLKAEKETLGTKTNNKAETILIIEDNKELREFLLGAFAKEYKVVVASDGEEGLNLVVQTNPVLILSDILMPRLNGIELCRIIKTNIETSHIPVILLTASNSEENRINGMEMGADLYIEKPFDAEFLKLQVKNIIQTREAVRMAFAKKIIPEPEKVQVESSDDQFVKKAIAIVEQHIEDTDFDVEAFVKAMNTGRTLLYNKIKALTDLSINEFILSIRIKRAAQLLNGSGLTISEIAFRTGFSSANYFSACFKKYFKQSPTAFAERVKHSQKID